MGFCLIGQRLAVFHVVNLATRLALRSSVFNIDRSYTDTVGSSTKSRWSAGGRRRKLSVLSRLLSVLITLRVFWTTAKSERATNLRRSFDSKARTTSTLVSPALQPRQAANFVLSTDFVAVVASRTISSRSRSYLAARMYLDGERVVCSF